MSTAHKFVALALALSVFAILVSPFAASELTTIRSPHKVAPPHATVPVALFAPSLAWLHTVGHATWETEQRLVLGGSAIVDLTSARLC